jgi:MoxR-like ATPase
LVESQLDRFALSTHIGYPDAATERQLAMNLGGRSALNTLQPVCGVEQWAAAIAATARVQVAEELAAYAVQICRSTRQVAGVRLGASPRATISLVRSAQAYAVLQGRDYLLPDDLQAMAVACLSHRLVTDTPGQGAAAVVQVLEAVPAPRP